MFTNKNFKKSCLSALRVGFCTALATAITLGTIALISASSPTAESKLAHVLKNLGPLGILFNWGLIPSAAGFIVTSFLELALWAQFKYQASRYQSHFQRLNKILSHRRLVHQSNIQLTNIATLTNAVLNLYALNAKELDYKVGLPVASIVGMLFSHYNLPAKMGHFILHSCQAALRSRTHKISAITIFNPLKRASEIRTEIELRERPGMGVFPC